MRFPFGLLVPASNNPVWMPNTHPSQTTVA